MIAVDLKVHNNDSKTVKMWKKLCIKELNWCRRPENEVIIRDKARNIYLLQTGNIDFKGKARCLDFKRLESVLKKKTEEDTE